MFKEIKDNLKKSINEAPELPAAEIQGRVYPEVLITDLAPDGLKAAVGPDRIAYLIGKNPLKIQIPNVKGIFKVEPSDIVFEAAGSYEKAFRAAMKKYGLSSLSDLDTPAEKKGFYNFVDKVWHSKEEKDKGEEKGTHKEMAFPLSDLEEELPIYSDFNKRHKTTSTTKEVSKGIDYDTKDKVFSEAIKASTMYGVVKGDPKGEGEVVFKGSKSKAKSLLKKMQSKGEDGYIIMSPSAKVGQRAYHKKGHGLKIEVKIPKQ